MSATDWAGFIVALISILGSTALGVKWLVKHYLNELKPNGGSSIKDKVSVLEDKVDFLTDLVKQVLKK
jgi:H+/Cl- antiporter ClcA